MNGSTTVIQLESTRRGVQPFEKEFSILSFIKFETRGVPETLLMKVETETFQIRQNLLYIYLLTLTRGDSELDTCDFKLKV